MRDSDTILLEEAYANLREGFISKAKAQLAGATQTAANIGQYGKKAMGSVQAATGHIMGNADMQQAGSAKIASANEYQQQNSGNVDQSKINSLTQGFIGQLDAEVLNLSNQLLKLYGVSDQDAAVAQLNENSPELGKLYTDISGLIEKIKNLG